MIITFDLSRHMAYRIKDWYNSIDPYMGYFNSYTEEKRGLHTLLNQLCECYWTQKTPAIETLSLIDQYPLEIGDFFVSTMGITQEDYQIWLKKLSNKQKH